MSDGIVMTGSSTRQSLEMRVRCMRMAIAAIRMVMMEGIDMMPIVMNYPTVNATPPCGIVAPIERRHIAYVIGCPEIIIYSRCIKIYRLYHIVDAIYILVTYHLYGYVVRFVFLNIDRSNVLVDVFRKHCLQQDHVHILNG